MRRAPTALLALVVATSARAVTFTQITSCCSPPVSGVAQPAWSSDPDKIALTWFSDRAGEVWITAAAITAAGAPLSGYSPAVNYSESAAWAPDATRYVCQWGGNRVPPEGLLVVDASGQHTQLTFGQHGQPAWSPGGATIVFRDFGDLNLWSVPASGGMAVQVTTQGGEQPCWSADGAHIVYTHAGDLWKIAAGGGDPVQLTSGPAFDLQPACSPNGLWIAFTSGSGDEDVLVMPFTGGAPIPLTTDPADDRNPSWAPGSDRIVFESTRSGDPNLWVASDLPDFTIAIESRTWTALKSLYQ